MNRKYCRREWKIIIAGGGTAGHLFPAIAIAESLQEEQPNTKILFVGTKKGIENHTLQRYNYPLQYVPIRGFYRLSLIKKLFTLTRLPFAIIKSFIIFFTFRPHCVIGVGGYAAFPVMLAALLLRIPIFLQEQNAVPGLTNRKFAAFVKHAFLAYPDKKNIFPKKTVVGNPLRKEIRLLYQERNKKIHQIFQITIIGGSQGSRIINENIMKMLPFIKHYWSKIKVCHQTGKQDFEHIQKYYSTLPFSSQVSQFFSPLAPIIQNSQLIISRAGSGCWEYVIAQKNTILIPISHSSGEHQKINAFSLLQNGIFHIIEEKHLTPNILAEAIIEQIENPFLRKYTENINPHPTILNPSKKISQFLLTFLEDKFT